MWNVDSSWSAFPKTTLRSWAYSAMTAIVMAENFRAIASLCWFSAEAVWNVLVFFGFCMKCTARLGDVVGWRIYV